MVENKSLKTQIEEAQALIAEMQAQTQALELRIASLEANETALVSEFDALKLATS